MALRLLTLALALSMVLASATAFSVKSSVSCVDCRRNYDYTGIRVMVTCDETKKHVMAMTKTDGSFEAKLPRNPRSLADCEARVLGGPRQLYASQKNMVSKLVRTGDGHGDTYTTSGALTFASACSTLRKLGKCGAELGSSKTFDLPIPPEYGLPPTSYYIPVLPIIGIP